MTILKKIRNGVPGFDVLTPGNSQVLQAFLESALEPKQ
jgi:hypothetical protein